MNRLVFALPFALMTTGAFAQDVPPEARMDLWCGMAFQIVIVAPPESTPDELVQIGRYLAGAAALIERGSATLLAAGFTAEAIDTLKADLLPSVTQQVSGTAEPELSPEDCSPLVEALLPPLPETENGPSEWWTLQ